ncbi:hypothetical protein CYLTODRAFT_492876 [Cylindrobasidium torrendii FP15055 ss-10]|uniref:DUF6534 domain-containing protein n=1 Tax=Cylindrobasidium torrendii FP15055 ss-10 TaxID=1314674 RepID=A0A0D7B5E0_9AGAR|nr:hypothetical protein CYLTODRAFT_492876 [Cylindrobasidium torrendii FP15055 ss-10]
MAIAATKDNTIGLLYISVVVGSALYGASLLQAWFYFRKRSHRDHWLLKACVCTVLLCDTAQLVLLSKSVYSYVVTHHGRPEYLLRVEKLLLIELFFSGSIGIITQSFYAWRIHSAIRSWILPGVVMTLGLASYVTLLVYTSVIMKFEYLAQLVDPLPSTLSVVTNATTALCDVVITVTLICYAGRLETGFHKSNDLLGRSVYFLFNTGIPTTLCAIVSLAMVKGEPNTFLYIMFYLLMGRFYTNSLLVTLNRSASTRGGQASSGVSEVSFNTVSHVIGGQRTNDLAIRVDTHRIIGDDDGHSNSEHYNKSHVV